MRLLEAAATLRQRLSRVAGSSPGPEDGDAQAGDWLSQVERGDWNSRLTEDDADALADRLLAAAEHLRFARELASGPEPAADGLPLARSAAGTGFAAAARSLLPLNRKERFYTGTVLPGLVAGDGLLHLGRFLRLCGLQVAPNDFGHPPQHGAQEVQLFTEYSFAESWRAANDADRLPNPPLDADTPDIVFCGPDWLLAIEAKMFHRPSLAALDQQMERQHSLVEYWKQSLHIPGERTRHLLLLPEQLAQARLKLTWPVITWEQVLDVYRLAGDSYWFGVLRTALGEYDRLASEEPTFRSNAQGLLAGAAIVDGTDQQVRWVGRAGGAAGELLAQDAASDTWGERMYEVRYDPPGAGNRNWMTIEQFRAVVLRQIHGPAS